MSLYKGSIEKGGENTVSIHSLKLVKAMYRFMFLCWGLKHNIYPKSKLYYIIHLSSKEKIYILQWYYQICRLLSPLIYVYTIMNPNY